MHVIKVKNAHQALPEGLSLLDRVGVKRDSRNGPVVVAPGPVTTQFQRPNERVLFWEDRDANPFFHLYEALWMLAGRNDVEGVARYVARMREFSDDGSTLHGAYGHRWRKWFGTDQLQRIAIELQDNPDSRRCVLGIWDVASDLGQRGKDLPCNTQVYLSRDDEGRLDMTVCNRSNDVIWGAYGANVVHFSVMQEFMAAAIGCDVGQYWQMSNNYHAYEETLEPLKHLADQARDPFRSPAPDPYDFEDIKPYPLVSTAIGSWLQDLHMLLDTDGAVIGLRDPFLRRVATPLLMAHRAWKEKEGVERFEAAFDILKQAAECDWCRAAEEWLGRRYHKWQRAVDDGPGYE